MSSPKELVEIYPKVFVPKEEVEAHTLRMSQEAEASKHPDFMSPDEEREWEISEKIHGDRENVRKKLEK